MHALIIEDELLLALAMEDALAKLGYLTFDVAASLDKAIAAAETQCPDLIVADHQIVGGTGTDAVQTICSTKAIPVVFVTGSAIEVRERLPQAQIVSKPFIAADLEAAIASAAMSPFRHSAATGACRKSNETGEIPQQSPKD